MAKPGTKRKIKFWRYYQEWIETYKKGSVRAITYQKWVMAGKHLKELAPNLMLGDITRFDIQQLINRYGQNHEKITVADFYHHLDAPIKDAVYEGWIDRDPCYKIQFTSSVTKSKKKKWLEAEEVQKLENVFKEDRTGYGDFLDLILRTGMRYAEALGITPKDIDRENMLLSVNKTMNYKGKVGNLDYGDMMPTKNKFSVRSIPIDYKALQDLQKHIESCQENESIMQNWYNHYILSDEEIKQGKVARLFNSTINKQLETMCHEADVPVISVHGLRHTHASLLIANRVSIQTVAKRLGHGDTETTQRVYIHLLDKLEFEDKAKIMNVMSTF